MILDFLEDSDLDDCETIELSLLDIARFAIDPDKDFGLEVQHLLAHFNAALVTFQEEQDPPTCH